jgi:Flp pilus assembly protein TadD
MRAHALEEARDLARRQPVARLPRLLVAHLAMSEGMVDESVVQLGAAVSMEPGDHRLRLFLSRALYASGDIPRALLHNVEASRLDPYSAEAASDRCAMLVSAGDFASAEAACRDAVVLDPDLAAAHANLGFVHSRRARLTEAEREYRTAIDLDPELLDARYNLAALLQREGRPGEGLAVLHPALSAADVDDEIRRLAAELAESASAGSRPGGADGE